MKLFILCDQILDEFREQAILMVHNDPSITICGAAINFRKKPSPWKKIKREIKKGRGGYVLIQILKKMMPQKNNVTAENFFNDMEIPYKKINKLYDDTTYNFIKEVNSDLIFLAGFGIIKEPLLSLVPFGVVSFHHGDMRKYRGGPPAFWELYYGEKEIGVTLQKLDKGLDCGEIVTERHFNIMNDDSWSSLKRRIYEETTDLLLLGIQKIQTNNRPFKKLTSKELGEIYTLPNFRQWFRMYTRTLINQWK